MRIWLALAVVLCSPAASADPPACRVLDLSFAPAAPMGPGRTSLPQIVAWLEDTNGTFVDTVYITHATGTFGIGNRPGRFDFNSGLRWPYGRRTTTFPVWSHRHGLSWPELVFTDGADDNLSHSSKQSSLDPYFCQPLIGSQLDAITCPTARPETDKGKLGTNTSRYPPRNDLFEPTEDDTADLAMFATLNPFDAVSHPTPRFGVDAATSYTVDPLVPAGDYVLWVEVSKEIDMNGTYNPTVYPSPQVAYKDHGEPYRGQPSVLYRVPIQLVVDETVAMTSDYVGYGDPTGADGIVRSPDSTISADIGSGSARLALLSANGETYRVRVVSRREDDFVPPSAPRRTNVADVTSTRATIELVAPGDDGLVGPVKTYEVRYLVGDVITEANFSTARLVTIDVPIVGPGEIQTLTIEGLLPETEYSVGIRALDDCRNASPLIALQITTPERLVGEVDACFIATAAYGSVMANDVGMLRNFRDAMLRKTALGELAVEAYYTFGPPAAGVIGESDLLRSTARRVLEPIVGRVRASM